VVLRVCDQLVVAVAVPTGAPASRRPFLRGATCAVARAHTAQALAKLGPCHSKPEEQGGTEGPERLLDGEAADVREGRVDHWKISVVQSPPWRRTSWARAGPSGRSWKSTKKSRSTSMPPSGEQFTRISHERSPG
jgi:hypothetical protein